MFIMVIYKDPAELSDYRSDYSKSTSNLSSPAPSASVTDLGQEKLLLVNPDCYVRVMLEYIRKCCKLPPTTVFDLCDDTGKIENLFSFPTYSYPGSLISRRTYYLFVIKHEGRDFNVFPQVNRENKLYLDMQIKLKRQLQSTMEKIEKVEVPVAVVEEKKKKK